MSFAWHEIRDTLMQSSSTLRFQHSFEALRRAGTPIAAFRDPAAVLDALHRGAANPNQKNIVLTTLIEAAQSDGPPADCALTVLLLALWPGLDAIRRRSIWRRSGFPEEVASEILARATEAIRSLDLQKVNWIAATLLRNIERDMVRARQREARRQSVISETDPDQVADDHDTQDPALGHKQLQGELLRLIGADATLVIRVAVEGFSQGEVAVELGVSEAAARKRYQRATRRLRDVVREIL